MLTAYRAAIPGIALVCSMVAFILAMCCLLAGTNPNTLPNMQLYTLNASRIGPTIQRNMGLPPPDPSFNFSTLLPRDITDKITGATASIDNVGSDIIDHAPDAIKDPKAAIEKLKTNITEAVNVGKQELESMASDIKSSAKNATAKIVSTFVNETIETLNIQDVYLAHLLTYCSGEFTTKGKQNITYCSNNKPGRNLNATISTHKPTEPFAFISDLHLPDPISFGMKAVTLLSKIIAAIYIIGIISIFVCLVASGFLIPTAITSMSKGSKLRLASFLFSLSAFLCLLLGTILVGFMSNKICGIFEEHKGLGIQAVKGDLFHGCSIAACVFMGIGLVAAAVDVWIGRMANKAKDKVTGRFQKGFMFRKKKQTDKEYDLENM